MWNTNQNSEQVPGLTKMEPDEVLYKFDEPLVFTVMAGFLSYLCIKIDETEFEGQYASLYALAPTNTQIVSGLTAGKISARSAFMQPYLYIAEAIGNNIVRTWITTPGDLGDAYLPEPHVGLYREHGKVFDRHTLQNFSDPFLGMYFSGGTLGRSIPLGQFRNIINKSYTTLSRLFHGAFSSYTANGQITDTIVSRILQIPVREPHFASLSLEIDKPVVDVSRVKKKVFIDDAVINKEIEDSGSQLIESVKSMIGSIENDLSNSFDFESNFSLMALLQGIVPDEETPYDVLSFSGIFLSGKLDIDRKSGHKVKEQYKEKIRRRQKASGRVVEINGPSETFLMSDSFGRITTCRMKPSLWDKSKDDLKSVVNTPQKIEIVGEICARPQRDLASVRAIIFPDGREYSI